VDATPSRLHEELPWDPDAKSLLDDLVQSQPMLIRISAAQRLREAVERGARTAGERRVTVERVAMSSDTLGWAS
jgi:chlorophyllide a reductase subunit Z